MIPNRTLHIVVLTVLMGVSLMLGVAGRTNAETANAATQWHFTLPDVEGNDRRVKITFVENDIRVHQTCTPFTAVWGQGEKVEIDFATNQVMCLVIPPFEQITAGFFADLKAYYPSDNGDTMILITRDNKLFEATRAPSAPEEGQIIWN